MSQIGRLEWSNSTDDVIKADFIAKDEAWFLKMLLRPSKYLVVRVLFSANLETFLYSPEKQISYSLK